MGKSKFVIGILIGFLSGIFVGDLFRIDLFYIVGMIIGLTVAIILMWRDIYWRLAIFGLIGLCLGFCYIQLWQVKQSQTSLIYDKEISFEANIISHPDFSASQAKYLLSFENKKIELQAGRFPEFKYGDRLRVKGLIKKPYEYLLYKNIQGQLFNGQIEKISSGGNIVVKNIYRVRDRFEQTLNQIFPEPLASFSAGLILGSKRNIPDSLSEDFNRTGTTHIIAVSGYNVTILIVYIGLIFGLISRRLKTWGSFMVIIIFVLMTGATASVVRAGILAGLVIFGRAQGRRINMAILVLLVAAIMVLFNPYLIKYDISFQLSFLAFLGLVYLSPVISSFKIAKPIPPFIRQTFAETFSAQLMVLPILVYYFGRASVISPIVNVLILWIVPAAMLLVFCSALAGFVSFSLGHIVGLFSGLALRYIIYIVQIFSNISWASFQIKTSEWWWMPIYFFAIGYLMYIKRTKPKEIL